ncbi:4'-phosphopantetheinyl transferase family protein [Kordiimonas aquimaris]|uniref:4'-phosphopantetheinyl transferase family protein n=1 Tax=Kordiimonas aquimaris TaxID=707591 RepID=UPI0021D231AB|nr:4'-phosphopantetheinyl transferase superfamily protein [Kordiimonas aquimaris]
MNDAINTRGVERLFPRGQVRGEIITSIDLDLDLESQKLTPYERKRANTLPNPQKWDYVRGRICSSKALYNLARIKDYSLLSDLDGVPIWPKGIVGSLSHTESVCGAVVAYSNSVLSMGFDIEELERISEEMFEEICTENELLKLKEQQFFQSKRNVSILFSAKEAFYKCYYPLYRNWLDFKDVDIELGSYKIMIKSCKGLRAHQCSLFEGRYTIVEQRVYASVYISQTDELDL